LSGAYQFDITLPAIERRIYGIMLGLLLDA